MTDNAVKDISVSELKKRNPSLTLRYIIITAAAFLLGASPVMGFPSPLPLALLGSLSGFGCLAAFVGGVGGWYFSGMFAEAIPMLSAMVGIGAMRLILRYSGRLYEAGTAGLTAVCAALTAAITANRPSELIAAAALGVFAGGLQYSLTVTYRTFKNGQSLTMLKPVSLAAGAVVLIAAGAALGGINVNIFNIGLFCAALVGLIAAKKYRTGGGAAIALLVGIGAAAVDNALAVPVLIAAVSAGISGFCGRSGRFTQAALFVLCSAAGTAVFGASGAVLNAAASVTTAAALYCAVPFEVLTAKIRRSPEPKGGADLSEIFAERLRLTGGAMGEIKNAVEKTAEVLDGRNTRDISWVYNTAADNVCRKCHSNMKCWGEEYSDNMNDMNKLMAQLRRGHIAAATDLPQRITHRCGKAEQLAFALNTQYREFVAAGTANRKIAEMRSVLTAQLGATEKMLRRMSDEFEECAVLDRMSAARVEAVLTAGGLKKPKAAVFLSDGKTAVECYGTGKLSYSPTELCNRLTTVLHRDFDLPDIIDSGKGVRITMYERATYCAEYGAFQISRRKQQACGDYYDSFVDGHGYAYVILSDGMGSGSRARIDSAFACSMLIKLLRANISLDAAMDFINTSLLVKSSDESFATLDICRIDLYSGRVELFKAGGAATFIRCGTRVVKADGCGKPIGIGNDAETKCRSFSVTDGDMIILASDGTAVNEKWLEQELIKDSGEDLTELAKRIAEAARFGTESGSEDDISVVAVRVTK